MNKFLEQLDFLEVFKIFFKKNFPDITFGENSASKFWKKIKDAQIIHHEPKKNFAHKQ